MKMNDIKWHEHGLDYLEDGSLAPESKERVAAFEEAYEKAWKDARPHLVAMAGALRDLQEIAQKYAVPMNFGYSDIGNNPYFPGNTIERFPDVPVEWIRDRTNVGDPYGNDHGLDYEGWQHSDAAC